MHDPRETDATHKGLPFLITGPGGDYRKVWRAEDLDRICLSPWLWLAAAVGMALIIAAAARADDAAPGNLRPLLRALAQVESGNNPAAVGDGGRAIGPYQIHLAYWLDAGGRAKDYLAKGRDAGACERAMVRYWSRYCPAALRTADYQTLARVHNGGPRGARTPATAAYWRRVSAAMAGTGATR